MRIVTPHRAAGATHVRQRSPTKGLQLFKRTDGFPRAVFT
jgi:hypothetical protein